MKKPIVVGITGGSGSGKTSFMRDLMEQLPDASLHSMDNYYIDIEKQPRDENNIENFDKLESIDIDRYTSDLEKLISGVPLEIDEYMFNNDKSVAKKIHVPAAKVLLVEGIFVLSVEKIRALMDLKLFVDAPDYLMMSRRIIRDAEERGYDLHDVIYRYQHHVTPAFKQHIDPAKQWADIIIPNYNDFNVALKVISTFLNQ
ncbi:MAG: uridine kinase [Bacteroidota bacterium]